MRFRLPILAWVLVGAAYTQPSLPDILSRIAEEAEVLQQNAIKTVTTETLEQRALLPPSRFRPRAGNVAAPAPTMRIAMREVTSEYSVGSLREADSKNLL